MMLVLFAVARPLRGLLLALNIMAENPLGALTGMQKLINMFAMSDDDVISLLAGAGPQRKLTRQLRLLQRRSD